MIPTYIFDCGSVLLDCPHIEQAEYFFGEDPEIDAETLWRWTYEEWVLQDQGMSTEEYFNRIKGKYPARLHEKLHDLLSHWPKNLRKIKGMEEIVRQLKESGKRLILLSNMPQAFLDYADTFEVLSYFDDLNFSNPLKLAKPDPAFFEYVIKKDNLDVKNCIFIDDNPNNIKTANSLGLPTYLFDKTKVDEFASFLEKEEGHPFSY